MPARYIELSGQHGFEGFVDGISQGQLKSTLTAEADWGMAFSIEDILRLMKEHHLKSLAMSEMPELPCLPDLPESFASFLKIPQRI